MPIVIPAPYTQPRRSTVLFTYDSWSRDAVITSPLASEVGTVPANLQAKQPSKFWGQAAEPDAVLELDRPNRQTAQVLSLLYANCSPAALLRWQLGDSVAEARGLHVYDASGHARHGALVGGATFGPGLFSGGISLTNTGPLGQYVSQASFGTDVTGAWTIAFLLRPRVIREQALCWHIGPDSADVTFTMLEDGRLDFFGMPTNAALIADVWHHLAVRRTAGGTLTILIDGQEDAVYADAPFTRISGEFRWGSGGDSGDFFSLEGDLDECRVYDGVAVSTEDLQATMARELTGPEATLCASYFRCNGYDSGTHPFAVPSGMVLAELPDPRCHSFHFLEQPFTFQYARATITEEGARRFGNLLIGTAWQPRRQTYDLGKVVSLTDPTDAERSPTGQLHTDPHTPYPGFRFAIDFLSEEELYADVLRLGYVLGASRPVLVVLNPIDGRFLQQKMLFGRLTQLPEVVERAFDVYQQPYAMEAYL